MTLKPTRLWAAFLLSGLAAAQSVSPPLVGIVCDEAGHARRVYGIAGNFILGSAANGAILSLAFSGKSGLVKTETQILLLDAQGGVSGSFDAPPGKALFAFHADGSPAYSYLPASAELFRIGPNGLETMDGSGTNQPASVIGLIDDNGNPKLLTAESAPPAVPENAVSLQPMGRGWLWIETPDGNYALRSGGGVSYRIPVTGLTK